MTRTRLMPILTAFTTVAMASASALAQSELRPPKFTESPSSPKILMLAVAGLLVAAVIFAASLKPKRTHQD